MKRVSNDSRNTLFSVLKTSQKDQNTNIMKRYCFPLPASFLLSGMMLTMLAAHTSSQASTLHSLGTSASSLESQNSSSTKEKLFTSIPFTRNSQDSLIVVSVQVNGHDPMPFLVDTGLNQPVVIEKWAADQLKLVPSQESGNFSPNIHPFPMTTLQSLVVKAKGDNKDIEYNSFPAYISDIELPHSSASHIAGVLGLPLFYQLVMQLDFSQNIINLSEQLDRSQLEPNAVTLPLNQPDPTNVRLFVTCPLRSSTTVTRLTNEVEGDEKVTPTTAMMDNLLLDTGANTSSLSEAVVSFVHPSAMSVGPQLTVEGWSQKNFAFVPKFGIGSFVISGLCVRSPSLRKDGLNTDAVGMDILQHFRVTLDFSGKQMILDKFDNQPSTGVPTTTGIMLKKRDTGFFVQGILMRSPAEKALIHVGDRFTEVDGTPISTDDDETAQQLLDGNANTEAKLMVLSADGKLRQVTVPRLTIYDASLYPAYGFLIVKRLPDQVVFVGYILCSSPAWAAGIRAGDVIVAVNKVPVKATDKGEGMLSLWPQKTLTLTVRRNGRLLTITLKKMPAATAQPAK